MLAAITNAQIFDGEYVIAANTVIIDGQNILSVNEHGADIPAGAQVIDARDGTLLPGLIDAHTHTKIPQLELALKFGVTTELEMMGHWDPSERKEVEERDDVADMRTAGFGMTAPGGHPSELFLPQRGKSEQPARGQSAEERTGTPGPWGFVAPTASSPEEAIQFVAERVADGADYIKIMIEEGSLLQSPNLPLLSGETIKTGVDEAHRHGKLAIAHVLTYEASKQAIQAGMDGLAHVFIDKPIDNELVAQISASGAFVTPCLVLNFSIMGRSGKSLAADERVGRKLGADWHNTLRSCFNTFPEGKFEDVLGTVAALHKGGVDVLVGTDASVPIPHLGGLAHGASVHHELQLLVAAGLTPTEALRAATALPAKRFGLTDRGRIAPGMRADLMLVDGDPTTNIADSLSIRSVWKRGSMLKA